MTGQRSSTIRDKLKLIRRRGKEEGERRSKRGRWKNFRS
jgi:hypothetical protein